MIKKNKNMICSVLFNCVFIIKKRAVQALMDLIGTEKHSSHCRSVFR